MLDPMGSATRTRVWIQVYSLDDRYFSYDRLKYFYGSKPHNYEFSDHADQNMDVHFLTVCILVISIKRAKSTKVVRGRLVFIHVVVFFYGEKKLSLTFIIIYYILSIYM